jgi:hypothetical protein
VYFFVIVFEHATARLRKKQKGGANKQTAQQKAAMFSVDGAIGSAS